MLFVSDFILIEGDILWAGAVPREIDVIIHSLICATIDIVNDYVALIHLHRRFQI